MRARGALLLLSKLTAGIRCFIAQNFSEFLLHRSVIANLEMGVHIGRYVARSTVAQPVLFNFQWSPNMLWVGNTGTSSCEQF